MLILLVTVVVPGAWWACLAPLIAGMALGIVLIVTRRTRPNANGPRRRIRTIASGVSALLAGVCWATSARAQGAKKPPVPVDAIEGILDAFRRHDVVGLSAGADHGDARGPEFVVSLIRDP